jgi:hypothetical protein
MKNHIGVKEIKAKPMTRGEHSISKGFDKVLNGNAEDEGYQVIYKDGYESWSPKDVFEEAYRETTGLTFGLAVEALKLGKIVSRKGWNGKNMYLEIQKPDVHSKMSLPYIYMSTACSNLVPWLASQTDVLSEDWLILE